MTLTELKEKTTDLMRGETALTALDFCLIGAILFVTGILIGMLISPFIRGFQISLFSNNGNDSGKNNGNYCGSTIGVKENEGLES